jgi:hypothetical protein
MKKIFLLAAVIVFFLSCTDNKKELPGKTDTKIMLRADTLNVVKLTDTLILYESVCRACAFEKSTHFEMSDSLGIIQLADVITTDNNPPDVDGGSISKDLIFTPVKTGRTMIKVYKFDVEQPSAEDSTRFTPYTIEVNK